MNPNKPLLGLCILILLAPAVLALSEETSSVSRIVGDSPAEMQRQMQREELDLRHAAYYTHDQLSQKDEILREQFGSCDPSVVDGTGACSQLPNHMDAWIDWADSNTAVKKQRGDKLTLNIYSEQDTSATISYNSAAFNGECLNGNFGVNEGLNTCGLEVEDETPLGVQKISVGSKTLDVEITDSSDLLIITDSEKLF